MKATLRRPFAVILLLIGIILIPSGLLAQAATSFLVASRPVEMAGDFEFQKLIEGYMKFELQRRRLIAHTSIEAHEATEKITWPQGEASPQELLKPALHLGRRANADFLILCSYRRLGPEMQLRLDCFDLEAGSLALSETAHHSLALLLDWSIADLVDRILEAIRPRLRYLSTAPESEALSAETPSAALEPRPRMEPTTPAFIPPVEPVVRPLEVSLCLSPLFTVGEAAEYFRLGFFPSVAGSYRLYTPAGHLGLGASIGLLMFSARSPSTEARGYLIPLAATVSFLRPFPGSRLTFHLQAASGPALFVLAPQSANPQAKILAYLGTGIGAELALSSSWGARLELDYSVFFEKPQPIMGYAPALYGFWRF